MKEKTTLDRRGEIDQEFCIGRRDDDRARSLALDHEPHRVGPVSRQSDVTSCCRDDLSGAKPRPDRQRQERERRVTPPQKALGRSDREQLRAFIVCIRRRGARTGIGKCRCAGVSVRLAQNRAIGAFRGRARPKRPTARNASIAHGARRSLSRPCWTRKPSRRATTQSVRERAPRLMIE